MPACTLGGMRTFGFVGLLCLCLLIPAHSQNDLLPPPTPLYYTVVSAGFGNLLYSLHYEEYGNSTAGFTMSVGRYYSPSTSEWTDMQNNNYYLQFETPGNNYYSTCALYPLSTANGRLVQGSTSLLVNLIADHVPFNNNGRTTSVRSQPSVQFHGEFEWTSNSIGLLFAVDNFLKSAFTTANVDTSTAYSITAIIDVYYASDASGMLLMAGGGYIPLRFTIGGWRSDGHGTRQLNIVYDFMQFAALDSGTIQLTLQPPVWNCQPASSDSVPPPVAIPAALQPINATLPVWDGGRAMFEITTNNAATQIHALLKSAHGQELLIYLADPNAFSWYSMLYVYDFADDQNFQFAHGLVYTLNGTEADLYYQSHEFLFYQFCTGQTITPSSVSPIQWLNAGSLNTIFSPQANFLSGAQPTGSRPTIRGISTDTYTIKKSVAYNGVLYNFTLTIYVTSNGWTNMGRFNVPLAPQIIRLAYSGMRYPAFGTATPYNMQIDFFMQHSVVWSPQTAAEQNPFSPATYNCPEVATSESVLPVLPAQYTVTVSEAWWQTWSSSQYTMYVDTKRNLRRIDGMFTAPNTSSLLSRSNSGSNYYSLIEWTQNITLSAGFSAQTLSAQNQPYTAYQPNLAAQCGAVTLLASDFSATASVNFFDWLAQANPADAVYISSTTIRGMDVDEYQVAMSSYNNGVYTNTHFMIYYLAADETTQATIPISAAASVLHSNSPFFTGFPQVQYEFYNFRSAVTPGTFSGPAAATCTAIPLLPIPVTNDFYYDPDPTVDGTPVKAPVWPSTFSLLIEGPLFASSGDLNIYTARWYADFANFRERLDIELAFNIPSKPRVTRTTGSFLYYYNQQAGGSFSFTDGTYVSYNGATCVQVPITVANMNPLKQVAPGNLFDTFFPQTTQKVSSQSTYNMNPRLYYEDFNGIYYDEYDWNILTSFNGQMYNGTQSIYVTIPEWVNNAIAGNYSNKRIPLSIQASASIMSQSGAIVGSYNPQFRLTHFQANNPGLALFDAALFGCATTPTSPWYNIYGIQPSVSSDGSSVNAALVVGVVVGVVAAIFLLVAVGYLLRKRGMPTFSKKYGMRSGGKGGDNELVGVGKMISDDGIETSLNRASLNKEGTVEVEETGIAISDSSTAPNSSDKEKP